MELSQYLDMWLEAHNVGLRPATVESYSQIVKKIQQQCPEENLDLEKLTPLQIPLFYAPQITGNKLRTAQLIYTVLKMALSDAVQMGFLLKNPMEFVKKPKNFPKTIEFLTQTEGKRLLSAPTRFQATWALCLLAGLRRGEAAALQWKSISNGKISVLATRARVGNNSVQGPPKSSSGQRILPMSGKLIALINQQNLRQRRFCLENRIAWSPESYVITPDGRPLADPRVLNKYLAADLARLGLPKVSCHSLRHSYATAAVAKKVDMRVLQALMGHENIHTTAKYYAHVQIDIMADANSAIASAYT